MDSGRFLNCCDVIGMPADWVHRAGQTHAVTLYLLRAGDEQDGLSLPAQRSGPQERRRSGRDPGRAGITP